MKNLDLGFLLLILGIGLICFLDSVAVHSIGCFISGVGLGLIKRNQQ